MSVGEITVIDDSEQVGWRAAATRTGEVYMTDVRSMVTNVLRKAGKTPITRLNILDHGNSSGLEIGSDWIDTSTFSSFEPFFLLLRGRFAKGGFVHLQHCQVGSNHALLTLFAKAFGVSVIAGTGNHNPVYRVNLGNYDRCDPSGVCTSNVDRP
jgi:hypothetical protein